MPPLDDAELIRRMARDRDPQAFAALYDRHAPRVFGLACRMLGRGPDAEDALQDAFLSVWKHAAVYDPLKAPVAAWVLLIARSRCIDRLRRRGLRREKEPAVFSSDEDGDLLQSLPEPGAPVLDRLEAQEQRARVTRALKALPPPQRAALEAAYFEGLTQQEIADKLKEPLGTVKTRMRLGLMKLAEALSAAGDSR
jgi:RNA polymerase sigma-70 factor, ECF subfamily